MRDTRYIVLLKSGDEEVRVLVNYGVRPKKNGYASGLLIESMDLLNGIVETSDVEVSGKVIRVEDVLPSVGSVSFGGEEFQSYEAPDVSGMSFRDVYEFTMYRAIFADRWNHVSRARVGDVGDSIPYFGYDESGFSRGVARILKIIAKVRLMDRGEQIGTRYVFALSRPSVRYSFVDFGEGWVGDVYRVRKVLDLSDLSESKKRDLYTQIRKDTNSLNTRDLKGIKNKRERARNARAWSRESASRGRVRESAKEKARKEARKKEFDTVFQLKF